MYIAYPERASAGKKARQIIKDISHGENPIINKQERNRPVRNNAHWYFSHRIFKSPHWYFSHRIFKSLN